MYFRLLLLVLIFVDYVLPSYVSEQSSEAPKIAVVGGGIGGASAAFNVRELFGRTAEIDLFEPKHLGGRVQIVTIGKRQYEAGASIIHTSNHYMVNYTKLLGLKVRDKPHTTIGIFDGTELRFVASNWQIVTLSKILWRYGLDIFRLNSIITDLTQKLLRIYDEQRDRIAFTTVERLLTCMDKQFHELCSRTIREVLQSYGISDAFINEFAAAGLMVNYGQTPDIHAFVGLVAMAAILPGIWSVHGGNKQVSEGLVRLAAANVIPAEVTTIALKENSSKTSYDIQFIYTKDNHDPVIVSKNYDIVIISTPLHEGMTDILFNNFPSPIKYYSTGYHRTLATFVQGTPNPSFFGQSASEVDAVLMNNPELSFNSFARQLPVDWSVREGTILPRPVFKIFSKKPLDDDLLNKMFMDITETQTFDWLAYPHYDTHSNLPSFVLSKNLFYINGIEMAASCMELCAIGGRNVALLAFNSWTGQRSKIDPDSNTEDQSTKPEL